MRDLRTSCAQYNANDLSSVVLSWARPYNIAHNKQVSVCNL